MGFVVIDVETANADLASICQVGIASYQERRLVDSASPQSKTHQGAVHTQDFLTSGSGLSMVLKGQTRGTSS
jgi:DNA polymerase III epsilon subunit-like protein